MIVLHQFARGPGVPNASPFCMKVEVWLKLAGLEYEVKAELAPNTAPLGKLPYIEDGERVIPDSSTIIEELAKAHGVDLDAGLAAQQKAAAHAFRKMLEEHTYWGMIYARWIDPEYWPAFREAFFGKLPPGVRGAVAAMVRRKLRRDLHGQGLGRHARDEIYRRTELDVDALSSYLGANPYFMGERPTRVDATVYAFLANMWEIALETPLKAMVGKHRNLVAYCERMKRRCFGEAKGK